MIKHCFHGSNNPFSWSETWAAAGHLLNPPNLFKASKLANESVEADDT